MENFIFRNQLKSFRCLMDVLEDTVDEKYYPVPGKSTLTKLEDMEERKALLFEPDESLKIFRENRMKRAGTIKGEFEQIRRRVYLPDGCCPTVTTGGGGK